MARGVNKAILIGNLGQEPEIRYTPSGAPVCNVSLATAEVWKDRESGEQREKTEWHRLVFFGRLAEVTHEYLHKGSQIYVEGRLQTKKWQSQNGEERMTTEIVVSDMQMLGSRSSNVARYDKPSESSEPPASPPSSEANNAPLDDEIPF